MSKRTRTKEELLAELDTLDLHLEKYIKTMGMICTGREEGREEGRQERSREIDAL